MTMCCSTCVFFFKQKSAYEMRSSDWSSYVCSSDLEIRQPVTHVRECHAGGIRGLQVPEQVRRRGYPVRVFVQFANQKEVGGDQGQQKQDGERRQAHGNGEAPKTPNAAPQPGRPRRAVGLLRTAGGDHWNRTMLMAAPRSPSFPPSLG